MNVYIARAASSAAAIAITWIIGLLGVPVAAEQVAGATAWLAEGLTALGSFLLLLFYGLFHKLISRFTNPADAAKEPQAAARSMNLL